jgi:hypothetical protein
MSLAALIAAETARPPPEPITRLAGMLADRIKGARVVLFYGSCLRDATLDGIVDLYVLTDHAHNLGDWLAPPNVHFVAGHGLKAKVAVMPLAAFARAMRPQAWSPHLWARFCQPAIIAWAADEAARQVARTALAEALRAAAWWAERLAPDGANAEQAWRALLDRTYGAEWRAEQADRPMRLIAADRPRWRQAAKLTFSAPPRAERRRARRSWGYHRRIGRLLAAIRLVKAAFTVRNGADYLAWKIERHTGRHIVLSDWQRRHPLLAALPIWLRLRRDGLIR